MKKYLVCIALISLFGFSCTDNGDEPDDGNGMNWSLSCGASKVTCAPSPLPLSIKGLPIGVTAEDWCVVWMPTEN